MPRGELTRIQVPDGPNRGLTLSIDPRTEIGYLRGDHEPWLSDALHHWLPAGGTFFDVGSHVGYFALVASRCVGPEGRVVALEPDPSSFLRLCDHVEGNGLTNVIPLQAAAWDEAGSVDFASSSALDGGVRGSVTVQGAGGIEVESITLDELADVEAPDAVKLDVEGGETIALRGAKKLLAKRCTRWIVEVHGDDLRQEVERLFRDSGHAVWTGVPRHATYGDYVQEYVVAVPSAAEASELRELLS